MNSFLLHTAAIVGSIFLVSGCDLFRAIAPAAQHITFPYFVSSYPEDAARIPLPESETCPADDPACDPDNPTRMQTEAEWRLSASQLIQSIRDGTVPITGWVSSPRCEGFVSDAGIDFEVFGSPPILAGVNLSGRSMTRSAGTAGCNEPQFHWPTLIAFTVTDIEIGQDDDDGSAEVTVNGQIWRSNTLFYRFAVRSYDELNGTASGDFSLILIDQNALNWQDTFTKVMVIPEGTFFAID